MTSRSGAETLTRRRLLRAALAVGGSAGLSACLDLNDGVDVPKGTSDFDALPVAQHAWNDVLVTDQHGNTVAPHYQLLLFLRYTGSVPPTDAERDQVESALRSLERAVQRGTGGNPDALSLNGLLTMIGYSPAYFDRFDEPLPESVDLRGPEAVLRAVDEDESLADEHDAVFLLTSDRVEVLLAAEQALQGERNVVNGITVESSISGVFDVVERRTGFKGEGLVSRKLAEDADIDEVHEESPSAMGYKSGFSENQATEDRVTIQSGPFAGGTTMHVSRLTLDLESWYDVTESERVNLMFSPDHTTEQVGRVGKFLASDSRVNEEMAAATEDHATNAGTVGHTQKLARARDEDFQPKILRRSEAVSLDGNDVGFNFTSLQRSIGDFVETRRAMEYVDDDAVSDEESPPSGCPAHGGSSSGSECPVDSGILSFLETEARANFLVPPRGRRALPTPTG